MKTALVLSGGGSKGAFQVGALQVLHSRGFSWDVVAGVSVGALNGTMVAMGRPYRLEALWATITERQVHIRLPVWKRGLQYLVHKAGLGPPPLSLYTHEPLVELIHAELDRARREGASLQVPLYVGRVCLQNGRYEARLAPEDPHFADHVAASATMPVIWPPIEIEGKQWVDGGIRTLTPLGDVLAEHDPDRVVIVTTEPRAKSWNQPLARTIFDVARQTIPLTLDEVFLDDIRWLLRINDFVRQAAGQGARLTMDGRTLKYYSTLIIEPDANLGAGLDFSRASLDRWIRLGAEAAEAALDRQGAGDVRREV